MQSVLRVVVPGVGRLTVAFGSGGDGIEFSAQVSQKQTVRCNSPSNDGLEQAEKWNAKKVWQKQKKGVDRSNLLYFIKYIKTKPHDF